MLNNLPLHVSYLSIRLDMKTTKPTNFLNPDGKAKAISFLHVSVGKQIPGKVIYVHNYNIELLIKIRQKVLLTIMHSFYSFYSFSNDTKCA